MLLETLPKAIRIATAAIQNDAEGAFVYVVNASKVVAQRRITLGPTEGEQVVVNNLAAGELVIVEGADSVHAGSIVDIAEQDGKAVAASPQQNSTNSKNFKHGKHS